MRDPDIRAEHLQAIARLLDNGNGGQTEIEHVRALAPGYSKAQVYLVWARNLEPLVVKVADPDATAREKNGRDNGYKNFPRLVALGLDQPTTPIEDSDGFAHSAVAYFWEGGLSYQEAAQRISFSEYLGDYREGRVYRDALAEVYRRILRSIKAELETPDAATPLPLVEYLRPIDWSRLNGLLGVAQALLDEGPELADLQRWYEDGVSAVTIAPTHDRRVIHGDLWFGNVLVDRVRSDAYVIDFGRAREAHLFQDLARFELDIWLHSLHGAGYEVGEESRAAVLAAIHSPEASDCDGDHPLVVWRDALLQERPGVATSSSFLMYKWFLLNEAIQRLTWIDISDRNRDHSRYTTVLIDAILDLWNSLSGEERRGLSLTSRKSFSSKLGVKHVYVPSGHSDNWVRNHAKKSAINALVAQQCLRLVAETGHSYLSSRGLFCQEIIDFLERGGAIEAVVTSGSEYERTAGRYLSESALARSLNKRAESMIGLQTLSQRYPNRISARFLSTRPPATILVCGGRRFLEPYLPLSYSNRLDLLFDTFELETSDGQDNHLSSLIDAHWALLWEASDPNDA